MAYVFVLACGLLALLYGAYAARAVLSKSAGTQRMQEIAAAVQEAMAALPEELRQAVTLREIEGLSYDEIAQAMACPIGTVRSRIFRAREAISARVKPMLERQTGKRW